MYRIDCSVSLYFSDLYHLYRINTSPRHQESLSSYIRVLFFRHAFFFFRHAFFFEKFFDEVTELREIAKELPYDFWVVLVGDTITEKALPTYESWLMEVDGVSQENGGNGWSKWIRQWTGEENRHGDTLNKYLYLSGRVNMREVEMTTQHLINDGFDIGTSNDPYKNFVYTSFQELATYISHNRVAQMAKKFGDNKLSKMCRLIAGDEMRHH